MVFDWHGASTVQEDIIGHLPRCDQATICAGLPKTVAVLLQLLPIPSELNPPFHTSNVEINASCHRGIARRSKFRRDHNTAFSDVMESSIEFILILRFWW